MSLKQTIRTILREESNIPIAIFRRLSLDELDSVFERSLDENTEDFENPLTIMFGRSYKEFAKVVIDDMVTELQGEFDIPYIDDEDKYNEKYREPLLRHYAPIIKDRYMDITSNSVNESVLNKETHPMMRRILRRVNLKKLEKMFSASLALTTSRYLENIGRWNAMDLNKFKNSAISVLFVEICSANSEICFEGGDYQDQVWQFLWGYYSDRIAERWEEIKPK